MSRVIRVETVSSIVFKAPMWAPPPARPEEPPRHGQAVPDGFRPRGRGCPAEARLWRRTLFRSPLPRSGSRHPSTVRSVTRRGRGGRTPARPRRHLPTDVLPGPLSYLRQTHVDPPARGSARARNGPVLPRPGTPGRALEGTPPDAPGVRLRKTADSPTGERRFRSLPF
jgi:hypothetical protein